MSEVSLTKINFFSLASNHPVVLHQIVILFSLCLPCVSKRVSKCHVLKKSTSAMKTSVLLGMCSLLTLAVLLRVRLDGFLRFVSVWLRRWRIWTIFQINILSFFFFSWIPFTRCKCNPGRKIHLVQRIKRIERTRKQPISPVVSPLTKTMTKLF